jgi:hypothetical protein
MEKTKTYKRIDEKVIDGKTFKLGVMDAIAYEGKGDNKKAVWSGEYSEPVTLADARAIDKDAFIMQMYHDRRKSRFLSQKRQGTATPAKETLAKLLAALKANDMYTVAAICKETGTDISGLLGKQIAAEEIDETEE